MSGLCPENGHFPEQNYASGISHAYRGAGALACGPHSSLLDLGAWQMLRAPFSAEAKYAA